MMRGFITYLMLLVSLSAMAQTINSVRLVDDGAAARTGAVAYEVSYELTLPQPKSDYSYTVTPVFRHGTDSLTDTPVTVRGRLNAKKLRRSIVLGDANGPMPQYVKAGEDSVVKRTITVSSAEYPWIKGADITLCIRIEGEGCCDVLETRYVCGNTAHCKLPFVPVTAYVEDNTGKAGELQKNNPVLQHISKYRPYDDTRILRKEKGALYVHFPVAKSTLLHDFRDNAQTLDKIEYITRAIMADTTSSVKIIQIIGLASVEGPQKGNSALAANRAEALKRYVQSKVKTPDSMYEAVNGGEAWTELRDQINDTDFEWRDALLNIIDSKTDADKKERQIRALDGGKAYAYLRENILKDQRNSGYVRIYYDYVPDNTAKIINQAIDLMKAEKYAEALALLEPVAYDKRSHSPLGVAYYMMGNEQKGIEYMRRAAAEGNENAKRNLQQLSNN